MKKEKTKRWKPKFSERYWFIRYIRDGKFDIENIMNCEFVWNTNHIKSGNCFRTKAEANKKLSAIKKLLNS